jgi:cell division protein FtsQ
MSALAARRLRLPRVSVRLAAIVAGAVVVLGCGWLWFRDSSLVSVQRVRITGVSGPHAAAIRGALRGSALTMTTLDVDMNRLRNSVEAYPDVVSLGVGTQFPHGIVIHVSEQIPVATVVAGGRTLAVDGGGALMRPPRSSDGRLPQLRVTVPTGATRLSGATARAALEVLAAAPWSLISHIAGAEDSAARGVVVSLRSGPSLLFGEPTDLPAKWAAAIAVLADHGSAGASYIDVSDPERPAAGGGNPAGATPASGATATSSTATQAATSTAAPSTGSAGGTSASAATASVNPTGG